MPLLSKILGVVVLYNVKINDSKTIASINDALEQIKQKLDLLVYDNSPVMMEGAAKFVYKNLNIYYVHDSTNSGVSKAYNFGADYAKRIPGKEWLLLLDQDTTFSNDLFIRYTEALMQRPDIKLFTPVLKLSNEILFSPCKYVFGRGFPLKEVKTGITSLKNISPVNSGILINLHTFYEVGMYKSIIKLDFSDFQFVERFKKRHSHFFVINSTGVQDFSNHETDTYKLNLRYSSFCNGAKNFDRVTLFDYPKYFIVAFMRAITLAYRTKSLMYFKTFYKSYIRV
jgi:rhamnosyltransferase